MISTTKLCSCTWICDHVWTKCRLILVFRVRQIFWDICVFHGSGFAPLRTLVLETPDTQKGFNDLNYFENKQYSGVLPTAMVVDLNCFSNDAVRGVDYYELKEYCVRLGAQQHHLNAVFTRIKILITLYAPFILFWMKWFWVFECEDMEQQVVQPDHLIQPHWSISFAGIFWIKCIRLQGLAYCNPTEEWR